MKSSGTDQQAVFYAEGDRRAGFVAALSARHALERCGLGVFGILTLRIAAGSRKAHTKFIVSDRTATSGAAFAITCQLQSSEGVARHAKYKYET